MVQVISVGPAELHKTITSALEAAEIGATIKVKPGIYKESLTISKDIIIVGEEGATVEAVDGPALYLCTQCSSEISDLKLVAKPNAGSECVVLEGGHHAILRCDIVGAEMSCVLAWKQVNMCMQKAKKNHNIQSF
jgi:hypothetical protein